MRIILRHVRDGKIVEFKAYAMGAIEDVNLASVKKYRLYFDAQTYRDILRSMYAQISDCEECTKNLYYYVKSLALENKGYKYLFIVHVKDLIANSNESFIVPMIDTNERTFSSLEELIAKLEKDCKGGIDLTIDENGEIKYKCFTELKNNTFS